MFKRNGIRERFALDALHRMYRAERRYGKGSFQYQKALRSRWLRGVL